MSFGCEWTEKTYPNWAKKVCLQNVFRLISIDEFCSQYQNSSIFNFTFTIMKIVSQIAVFRLKIFCDIFKVALFQVCDPIPHWGHGFVVRHISHIKRSL